MAATDAKPIPVKGQAYRVTFPILDADGDLVSGAADLDSEVSKDGGAFTDCTNEATEIATSSGIYYLDLTADEKNADTVTVVVKTSSSGAKTTSMVLYPAEDVDIPVNVKAVSDDTGAAGNMESAFDGTGYEFAGCTMPTVTDITNKTGFEIAGTKNRLDDLNDIAQSDILSDATPFAGGNIDAAISSRSFHSADDVADKVWDEAISEHTAVGTFGAKNQRVVPSESVDDYKADVSNLALETTAQGIKTQTDKMQFDGSNNIQSRVNDKGVLNDPSADDVADKVWDEAIADHITVGTFGAKNQRVVPSESVDDYKADVSSLALETTAQDIKTQTDKLQFDGSNNVQSRVNDKGILNDPSATDIDSQLSSTHGSGSWEGSGSVNADEIADKVWDEAMSEHMTAGTFGQAAQIVRANTAQSGGSNTITLDSGASSTDDWYVNQTVFIVEGTGAGQSRKISTYNGSTKVATVDSNWATTPDNTSKFLILPNYILTGTGASASEVWSYSTRSLTDKSGFTIAGTKTTLDDLNDLAQSDILSDATPFAGSNIDAAISSRSSHSVADIWSYTTRSLTDKAGFTISGTKTTLDDLNDLSAADVNAEVDAALADIDLDHLIQVSAGAEKPTIGSYLDLMMNKDSNQTYDQSTDSMEALRDVEPHGTPMRGTDNAALASVCSEARLSELDAANMPSDIDAILEDTGTTLENHLTDIKDTGFVKDTHSLPQCLTATGFSTHSAEDVWNVATRSLTETVKITGTKQTLDDLNDLSAADINAEVSDVLKVDTISEMSQGAPPVDPTFEEAINYIYRKFRNKTETSSTEDMVYNDSGDTVLFKATISDNGTVFTKEEYVSGA